MMKKVLKFSAWFVSIAFFVVCMCTFVIIIVSSMKKTVPSVFNVSVLSLSTQSMEPTYMVGDIVVVKKVEVSSLKEGDVISFYSTDPTIYGYPNTHRIVGVDNTSGSPVFTTKGDNNPSADDYTVESGNVIGKVIFKISSLGKAIMYLQRTKLAYFIVIILPLFVLFAFEMKNVMKKYKEGKGDKKDE